MKAWFLLTIGVAGIACTTTTTVGSLSDGDARRWLDENRSSEMTVETKESPSGLDDVRIEAISPTDVRFRLSSGQVLPIGRVRRVTVRNHWQGGLEGMLIGGGAGVAVGVLVGLLAATRSSSATAGCDICLSPAETGAFAGLLFGVPALVTGLIGGAIKGHEEVLELK